MAGGGRAVDTRVTGKGVGDRERWPWGKLVKSKIERSLKHSQGVTPSFCRQKGATGGSYPKKS